MDRVLLVYVLEASRTSGDNNATIIVGDAISGAAWVAASPLVKCDGSTRRLEHTEPCGSAVGVEVVNLCLVSSCSSRKQALYNTYIHVDGGVEVSIELCSCS
jgi:hypothetical protein